MNVKRTVTFKEWLSKFVEKYLLYFFPNKIEGYHFLGIDNPDRLKLKHHLNR